MRSTCVFVIVTLSVAKSAAADKGGEPRHEGVCPGFGGDDKCRAELSGSYCKYYQNPPVCSGTDTPCGCGSCSYGDDYCKQTAGGESYCKFWLSEPVCQGTNDACGCKGGKLRVLSEAQGDKGKKEDKDVKNKDDQKKNDDKDGDEEESLPEYNEEESNHRHHHDHDDHMWCRYGYRYCRSRRGHWYKCGCKWRRHLSEDQKDKDDKDDEDRDDDEDREGDNDSEDEDEDEDEDVPEYGDKANYHHQCPYGYRYCKSHNGYWYQCGCKWGRHLSENNQNQDEDGDKFDSQENTRHKNGGCRYGYRYCRSHQGHWYKCGCKHH